MTNGPPSFVSQRATVLKILCVPAVVIVLVASTLFLGATSHRLRTGSVAGMLSAVRESVRLQGKLGGLRGVGPRRDVGKQQAREEAERGKSRTHCVGSLPCVPKGRNRTGLPPPGAKALF